MIPPSYSKFNSHTTLKNNFETHTRNVLSINNLWNVVITKLTFNIFKIKLKLRKGDMYVGDLKRNAHFGNTA
jgi:hypothetical protein